MRLQLVPVAVSGLVGIALGFGGAWSVKAGPASASSALPLRPQSEARAGKVFDGSGAGGAGEHEEEPRAPGTTAAPGTASAAGAPSAEGRSRDAELRTLRARESVAQAELTKARGRITQLEKEMARERPEREPRQGHEYDLTPEDWKQMAADGAVKYRVPCTASDRAPRDENLAMLGLAPEDYETVREVYENSVARQEESVFPLCAAALGDRMDLARSLNFESCMTIIMSTAPTRSESLAQSARAVAAFMAGDAPRPGAASPLVERVFLALAEEPKRFEEELAAAFGPEEAHQILYSDLLCFARSSYSYGMRKP